jgi:hypothetical protein
LALQGAVGNRATARLLQRRTPTGYAGLKLGRNRAGRDVEIKRELGTLGGYALILGVDGGEVLLNRTSFDRKAGKVNVTADLAKDRSGKAGAHGRESRQDEGFEPGPSRRSSSTRTCSRTRRRPRRSCSTRSATSRTMSSRSAG